MGIVASALSFVFIYWKCPAESAVNYIPETLNLEIFWWSMTLEPPSLERVRRSDFSSRAYTFKILRYAPELVSFFLLGTTAGPSEAPKTPSASGTNLLKTECAFWCLKSQFSVTEDINGIAKLASCFLLGTTPGPSEATKTPSVSGTNVLKTEWHSDIRNHRDNTNGFKNTYFDQISEETWFIFCNKNVQTACCSLKIL